MYFWSIPEVLGSHASGRDQAHSGPLQQARLQRTCIRAHWLHHIYGRRWFYNHSYFKHFSQPDLQDCRSKAFKVKPDSTEV